MSGSLPAPPHATHHVRAAHRPALWAGILLIVVTTLIYGFTLDNGLEPRELDGGDLITHQYAQVQARPSNAPGYPLYTMGGWLWFHGLRGIAALFGDSTPNPIPILSSYSMFWAIAAIGLLYWILCFLTGSRYRRESLWGPSGNWPVAFLVSAYYAVTYFFWYYATTTEQYSSAIAQTLAIVAVYLLWQEADVLHGPQPYRLGDRPGLLLTLLAFLCGISLAHMLTVAFIVPPIVAAVLWQRPRLLLQGWIVAAVVVAALLPTLSYAFVYARAAQHPEWRGSGAWPSTWDWFVYFLSTPQGRDELREGFRGYTVFFANGFPEVIWRELSPALLLIGLAGLAGLKRRTAVVFYATLAIYLLFCWAYRYANWYQVVLPAYPLILIGGAVAADRIQEWPPLRRSPALRALPLLLLAFATIWRAALSLPEANSRNRPADTGLDRAAVLIKGVPPNAALFGDVHDVQALDYLTVIWGLHPDAALVSSLHASDALEQGRPLLSTWEAAPTLLAEMRPDRPLLIQGVSPDWVRIDDAPMPAPLLTPVHVKMVDGVKLAGYSVAVAPSGTPITETTAAIDVMVRWQLADGKWPEGVSLSVRPTLNGAHIPRPGGAKGDVIQIDAAEPLRGLRGWDVGAEVVDAYRIPLAQSLPSGADGLALILYRAVDGSFDTLAEARLEINDQR